MAITYTLSRALLLGSMIGAEDTLLSAVQIGEGGAIIRKNIDAAPQKPMMGMIRNTDLQLFDTYTKDPNGPAYIAQIGRLLERIGSTLTAQQALVQQGKEAQTEKLQEVNALIASANLPGNSLLLKGITNWYHAMQETLTRKATVQTGEGGAIIRQDINATPLSPYNAAIARHLEIIGRQLALAATRPTNKTDNRTDTLEDALIALHTHLNSNPEAKRLLMYVTHGLDGITQAANAIANGYRKTVAVHKKTL